MNRFLFSIVVITYNQESLVLETLDSIYRQTFKNIELIISDDASQDSTVSVIERWLQKNRNRFVNTILNVNKTNLGIVKNHNVSMELYSGDFVKTLGGDDILLDNAVEIMYDFLVNNPSARFCSSKILSFYKKGMENVIFDSVPKERLIKKIAGADQAEMLKLILRENFVPAPGTFFRRSLLEDYGHVDESFELIEDWPQWIKFILNGEKIYFLDKPTVLYRVHKKSVNASAFNTGNTKYYSDILKVYKNYILPNVDRLPLPDAISAVTRAKIYSELLKNGIGEKNYRKIRFYRLADPIWWLNIPYWIPRKVEYYVKYKRIFNEIFGDE